MFHSIPGVVMEEKLQLRELNKRLEQYLSRVRQLEEENQLLAEEIRTLRSEQQAGWQRSYGTEISDLRRELGELRTDTLLAERDRDQLRQELAGLQRVCAEIQSERKAIEAELARLQNELQQADLACAALEDLLRRLRGEYSMLDGSQERELLQMRQQVNSMPARTTLSKSVQSYPTLNLTVPEYDYYKQGLSESWRETIEHYQRKIQDLEDGVLDDEQRLAQVNEENKRYAHDLHELSLEMDELDRIRQEMENELLQLKEALQQDVEGYLATIDELEDEKHALSADLAQHLNKQKELMQVKMGLHLEVAAYRALLEEEECNPGSCIWTEQNIRELSPGSGTKPYQYSFSDSAARREADRNVFPAARITVTEKDTRFKPTMSIMSEMKTSNKNRLPEKQFTGSSMTVTNPIPFSRSTQFHQNPVLFSTPLQSQKSTLYQKCTFKKGEPEKEAVKPSTVSTNVSESVVQGSGDLRKHKAVTTLPENKVSKAKGISRLSDEDKEKIFRETVIEIQTANDKQTAEQKEREPIMSKQQILSSISMQPLSFGQISEEREIPITLLGSQKNATTPEMLTEKRGSKLDGSCLPLEGKSTKQSEKISTVEQDVSKNEIAVETKSDEYMTYQQIPVSISTHPVTISKERKSHISSKSDTAYPQTLSEVMKPKHEHSGTLPVDVSGNTSEETKTDDKLNDNYQTSEQTLQGLLKENIVYQLSENVTERDVSERLGDYLHGIEVTLPASESKLQSQEAHDILRSAKETQLEYSLGDTIPITDILEKVMKSQALEETFSSFPDAGVTYHIERQDVADGGSRKTEITLKTSVQEDIDISDESALENLLNKETKNVTLEEIKETPVGSIVENLIGLNMPEKEPAGLKSISVQIIEEPLEFPGTDKDVGDYEKYFKIEELEGTSSVLEGSGTSEKSVSFSVTADEFGKNTTSKGNLDNVAEISVSDRISSEPICIVSTPDDFSEDETETIPCHKVVEISSESLFIQPTEVTVVSKLTDIPEQYETEFYGVGYENVADAGMDIYKDLAAGGKITIVEEISVPYEVHTSVVELSKEDAAPKIQLGETMEYLKDKISDSLREGMSSLTGSNQDDTDSYTIGVRKVEQTSDDGKVTIVAEVGVSQELEADAVGLMKSSDNNLNELIIQSINPEIQKVLNSRGLESISIFSDKAGAEVPDSATSILQEPLEDQTVYHVVVQKSQNGNEHSSENYEVHDLYTTESKGQGITEDQGNEDSTRVSLGHLKDSISDNLRQELSSHKAHSQDDTDSYAVDVRKVEQTSDDGSVTIVAEVSVSKELGVDDVDSMKSSDDNLNELIMESINPEIQKLLKSKGLENVNIFKSEDRSEISGPSASALHLPLEDQTVYHVVVQKSPDGTEHSLSKYEVHDVYTSESKEPNMNEDQDDHESSRTVRHVTLGPNESSFTFQMDVASLASEVSTEDGTQHPKILYLHKRKETTTDNEDENVYDSGHTATEGEHCQTVYEFHVETNQGSQVPDEDIAHHVEFTKSLQLQRMVDPRSVVSDEKKIAVMYLEEDENPDQPF